MTCTINSHQWEPAHSRFPRLSRVKAREPGERAARGTQARVDNNEHLTLAITPHYTMDKPVDFRIGCLSLLARGKLLVRLFIA